MSRIQRASLTEINEDIQGHLPSVAGSGTHRPDSQQAAVDAPLVRWVLICTGLIPLVLTSAWLIAGAMQVGPYDATRQTISVLAGHAGTHRWIVTAGLAAAGLCYFAAAAGLAALRTRARIGLVISGAAAIGVAASPEPVVGTSVQHMTFTSIGAASIAVWPALTAQRNNPASVLTSAPVAISTTALFLTMLAWLVIEAQTGTAVGMVERLDSSSQIAWPFVVALTLRSARLADGPPLTLTRR
jgi:uncharacterized protein DUF998